MKIALIGAPGAGKSEIATRLSRNLNRDHKGKWKVIDGYVDRLAERTGCEYGRDADYTHNAQVMCERWTLEAEALHQGFSTITCGSIYETILWSALLNSLDPPDEQQLIAAIDYARMCMTFFGAMEKVTFNYNCLFYVPWDAERKYHTWDAVINAKLPEVLEGQFRYAVRLTGTTRQKVANALETIRIYRDTFTELPDAPEDEQPGV
jgi:hypothetical protein